MVELQKNKKRERFRASPQHTHTDHCQSLLRSSLRDSFGDLLSVSFLDLDGSVIMVLSEWQHQFYTAELESTGRLIAPLCPSLPLPCTILTLSVFAHVTTATFAQCFNHYCLIISQAARTLNHLALFSVDECTQLLCNVACALEASDVHAVSKIRRDHNSDAAAVLCCYIKLHLITRLDRRQWMCCTEVERERVIHIQTQYASWLPWNILSTQMGSDVLFNSLTSLLLSLTPFILCLASSVRTPNVPRLAIWEWHAAQARHECHFCFTKR